MIYKQQKYMYLSKCISTHFEMRYIVFKSWINVYKLRMCTFFKAINLKVVVHCMYIYTSLNLKPTSMSLIYRHLIMSHKLWISLCMCTYLHIIVHLPLVFSEAKNNTLIFKWLSLLKISMYNYVDISSMCTCILKLVTKILLSQGISYIWCFHLFCKTPSVKSTFSLHWVYIHK